MWKPNFNFLSWRLIPACQLIFCCSKGNKTAALKANHKNVNRESTRESPDNDNVKKNYSSMCSSSIPLQLLNKIAI